MKKLILITSALLLTTFAYAGDGDANQSCAIKKKSCCCCQAACDSTKPKSKCGSVNQAKAACKATMAPVAPKAPKSE